MGSCKLPGFICLIVLLLVAMSVPAKAQTKPLLGGSLTWAINRDFRKGVRKVSMTLKTAWTLVAPEPCVHLPGNKVSKCETPKKEPMARLGRLCYYLCDNKGCTNIRDDVHLNTSLINDFTVQQFDRTLGYMSGELSVEVNIPPQMVNMYAFLCFDDWSPVALGPEFDWYGMSNADAPNYPQFNLYYPRTAGAPRADAQGRYFGSAFLDNFPINTDRAITSFGHRVKLLSTFLQLCCTDCTAVGEKRGEHIEQYCTMHVVCMHTTMMQMNAIITHSPIRIINANTAPHTTTTHTTMHHSTQQKRHA